jgi:hypothetical protein
VSDLDEFVKWIAARRGADSIEGLGYGTLTAAVDMFRAERLTGRRYTRWVDAYEALHPKRPSDDR